MKPIKLLKKICTVTIVMALIPQFALANPIMNTLKNNLQKYATNLSNQQQNRILDVSEPPNQDKCTNFAGHWVGECIQLYDGKEEHTPIDGTVEQDKCQTLAFNGDTMTIDTLDLRSSIFGLGGTVMYTSYYWNQERTELLLSGRMAIKISLMGAGSAPIEIDITGRMFIENDQLIQTIDAGPAKAKCTLSRK
ncbi:MAG: hypothetical protein AABZ06_12060 [Bdellovibrionota bacterium]